MLRLLIRQRLVFMKMQFSKFINIFCVRCVSTACPKRVIIPEKSKCMATFPLSVVKIRSSRGHVKLMWKWENRRETEKLWPEVNARGEGRGQWSQERRRVWVPVRSLGCGEPCSPLPHFQIALGWVAVHKMATGVRTDLSGIRDQAV